MAQMILKEPYFLLWCQIFIKIPFIFHTRSYCHVLISFFREFQSLCLNIALKKTFLQFDNELLWCNRIH